MVDLDSVIEHAHDLGREVTPASTEVSAPESETPERPDDAEPEEAVNVEPVPDEQADVDATDDTVAEDEDDEDDAVEEVAVEPIIDEEAEVDATDDTVAENEDDGIDANADTSPPSEPPTPPEGTLIVPLDAWNKMLNQLGNLHEAGQQLAEARERAAKAETEATFLRERLAELRASDTPHSTDTADEPGGPLSTATADDPGVPLSGGTAEGSEAPHSPSPDDGDPKQTTSYWKYLTFGWRDRKKRAKTPD
jgi:hypothetical protein